MASFPVPAGWQFTVKADRKPSWSQVVRVHHSHGDELIREQYYNIYYQPSGGVDCPDFSMTFPADERHTQLIVEGHHHRGYHWNLPRFASREEVEQLGPSGWKISCRDSFDGSTDLEIWVTLYPQPNVRRPNGS